MKTKVMLPEVCMVCQECGKEVIAFQTYYVCDHCGLAVCEECITIYESPKEVYQICSHCVLELLRNREKYLKQERDRTGFLLVVGYIALLLFLACIVRYWFLTRLL